MTRILLFLLLTTLLVVFAVALASNDGLTVIDWYSMHIEMHTSVAIVLFLGFSLIFWLVIRFVGGVGRLPGRFGQSQTERRLKRAGASLGEGLAAVRGGAIPYASSMLRDSEKVFPESIGVKLLAADLAFARGDFTAARDRFRELSENARFRPLGKRGLLEIAQAEGNEDEALVLAREAVNSGINASWATGPLFQILCRRHKWDEALGVLGRGGRSLKADDPNRPVRAALLCASARDSVRAGNRAEAIRLAQQALSLDPGLTEATLIAARALVADGKPRKAVPLLTAGWKRHPHPEILKIYLSIESGLDPIRRLQRVEGLIEGNPTHPESRLALAEACLGAKLWGQARHTLDPLVREKAEPSPSLCRLVALLEEGENRDMALANQWLMLGIAAKPTEGWFCRRCDAVHNTWEPICPACGSLGTLIWDTLPGEAPASGTTLPKPSEPAAPADAGDKAKTEDKGGKAA
ncbi:heme biosynthesis protein HemY [Phaeovibrio sulfidiphilus]|uniref:Heme biosynthesis protein HemY n=1 Tax=Phaeovibrio sulfidiphilus TaxID=1220600 RepID=A0A8J7CBZ7_9PROT|nr:tetratricopeptide repeat protein [Phaeovibrio sulfidiphilus]MBE1236723.1 heme biosynthesis protein HemY [Phaeovibrio sulfidiphilus]